MNTALEFSTAFDTLLNSYNSQAEYGDQSSHREIALDEYEKSLFLTKAQDEIVVNIYNGRNTYGLSFEGTEEARRYLESLVKTKIYTEDDQIESDTKVTSSSVLYELPTDIAFITMEQVTYSDESLGCYNGSNAAVYPVTQDEFSRVRENPFRGPTKYKVLRLDAGASLVELVSKYKIGQYLLKYLAKPQPIILVNLQSTGLKINGNQEVHSCDLHPILHGVIIDRAVQLALQSKGLTVNK